MYINLRPLSEPFRSLTVLRRCNTNTKANRTGASVEKLPGKMDAFLYIQINACLFFYFPNIQGLYAKEGTRPHMFITRQSGHYKVHILYYNVVFFVLG